MATRKVWILGAASLLTYFGSSGLWAAEEAHAPHWAYSGDGDPAHWGALGPEYSACALGHAQSPIDISHAQVADLPPLVFNYKPTQASVTDNGHTIQVNMAPGNSLTIGGAVYELKQFHFHHPSEEHIDGKGFPLVVHLVHQDSGGHLAVVAVLFEDGTANALVSAVWRNIPAEKGKAHLMSDSIQPLELVPDARQYFTYSGSLTTPPCTEGVTWYVFKSQSTVSSQQIATFAKIYPIDARPIQLTNGRTILQSR